MAEAKEAGRSSFIRTLGVGGPDHLRPALSGRPEQILCRTHASFLIHGPTGRGRSLLGIPQENSTRDLGFGTPGPLDEEELSEGKRLQILQFIESHPGTHLRGIMRGLNLPMGVLQYHLYRLEKGRAIVSRRRYMYKRYYRSLLFSEKEQAVLDVLSQESEVNILIFLVSTPNQTLADIARSSRLANSTVFWHLKRLAATGLVSAHREGSRVVYSVEVEKDMVLRLMKSYHPTLWERLSDRLADAVLGASSTSEELASEELLSDSPALGRGGE